MKTSKIDISKKTSELQEALLQVNRIAAFHIIDDYCESTGNYEILEEVIINALENIGLGWENGEYSLSQVYMSGIICEELMSKYIVKVAVSEKRNYKMAIGVLQDYHSLGKRIVSSILLAGGYEIIDFGQGLEIDDLVKLTIDNDIDFLLISVLMISSALEIKTLVRKLREKDVKTKVIVGGAPFRLDKNLWKKVNADAYGNAASDIIGIIEKLS